MRFLFLAALCAAQAWSHEIGTSRVAAVFHANTYNVEIVTDATALAEKLEAAAGRELPATTDASRLHALLTQHDESFRRRVRLAFDDAAVTPSISYSVAPPMDATSAAAATIRLTGDVPAGARQFTWQFGWTFASYALTVRHAADPNVTTQWVEGRDVSKPFALASPVTATSRLQIARQYLLLGFTHILPLGFDHVLFVVGICLLTSRARSILAQVTAFTIAHSITLGLSMYGLVSAPARIVEPMIAISIAYVAIENIFLSELKSWRIALVFAFGLLHGMGFAGVLQELGLPRQEFLTALLTFNLGVEAGQLTVIGLVFLLVGWHCANQTWYRRRVVVPASAVIALTAVYWTIERIAA